MVQVDLEFNIQLLVMEVDGMREFSIQYNSNEFYKVLVSKCTYLYICVCNIYEYHTL